MADSRRVLLLIASTSYKAMDFLEAASRLGVAVTVGTNHEATLAEDAPGGTLALDFSDSPGSIAGGGLNIFSNFLGRPGNQFAVTHSGEYFFLHGPLFSS